MTRDSAIHALIGCCAAASLLNLAPHRAGAQQVNLNQPFQANGHSFFEQSGMRGGARGNNFYFNLFGGLPTAPFGNPNPQAGVQGGVGFAGGGLNGGFDFGMSQGGRFSSVSQTGNLTVTNGYPGVMNDLSFSPFVTGLIPVVGDRQLPWKQQWEGAVPMQLRSTQPAAANEAVDESRLAAAGELQSVDEIRRRNAERDASVAAEVREQLARASDAAAKGKPRVALIYLRAALRTAPESLRADIQARIDRLAKP